MNNDHVELMPDSIAENVASVAHILKQMQEERERGDQERLAALSRLIAGKRDEAVKARAASGIETIIQEDQEYYEGIDEHNKSTLSSYTKESGGISRTTNKEDDTAQCTAFFNMTSQFVDSASARCGDILLPAGDWNWGVKKTPVTDAPNAGNIVSGVEGQPQQDDNAAKVRKGETRIKDWLTEARYHREYRKALESAARLGTGVLKGPYPVAVKSKAMINGQLVWEKKIVPVSKAIDLDKFYPDMSCGDDIQKGDYVFEKDFLNYKQLFDLKESGGDYIAEAIDKVLKEGPGKGYLEKNKVAKDTDLFTIWFFVGNIDMNDMDLVDKRFAKKEAELTLNEDGVIEVSVGEDGERGKDFKSVVLVLVNDTVIKGHLNPLDNGEYPYDVMRWKRAHNSPFGIGVSRQMRVWQQLLLSTVRNLVDNTNLSAMPMIAMRRAGIEPADGKWELKKSKVWWLTEENIKLISEAIQFLEIPSMQGALMEIIALATKMAEETTGVNSLLQGQQGSAPDTVGGAELLHKNASALLRRVARMCDEETEAHIRRYYDWLLMHGEDDEKGDFEIEAIGSTVLVEREIQAMQAQLLLQFAQDPSYGLSKPKIMSEVIKGWKMESSRVMMDEEEKQALSQQQQPSDPRLEAEKLRSQTALQIAEQNAEVKVMQIKKDQDRDAIFAQGVTERTQADRQSHIEELQLRKDLALLEYANKHQMQLDDIKAKLADSSMKLAVQKELSSVTSTPHTKQVIPPPSEPPQQAPNGQAFQQ